MKSKLFLPNPFACKSPSLQTLTTGLLPALTLFVLAIDSQAAPKTWDGGAGDLLWNSPANWDGPDALPLAGDDTAFSGNVGTVKLDTDPTIGTLSLTVATGETIAFNTDAVNPHTLTINTGITTVGTAGTLALNAGTTPNFLGVVLGGNSIWSIGRSISVNSIISETGGSRNITKTNATGALTFGGDNTFSGGVIHQRGTINMTGGATNKPLGTGPFTFANLSSGGGSNTLSNNSNVSRTLANDFVQNNAATAGSSATIDVTSSLSAYRTQTFTGAFSTGGSHNPVQILNFKPSNSSTAMGEGTVFLNGSFASYSSGPTNDDAIRLDSGGGSLVLGANAIAASGGYAIQANDANIGGKLILSTAATMPNKVKFSGTANNMRSSLGAIHASGTATLSGNVTLSDLDGANIFSKTATLDLTGVVSGANALRINDGYTFTSADTVNSLETPVGTVSLTNSSSNINSGGVTVVNGTFLVNGDPGVSGTGSGTVTVGTARAAVVAPQAGAAVANTRVITGVTTATAQALQIGQGITGTNIPASSVITGITIGSGAGNSTIVINNTIATLTPDVQFTTTAFSTAATLGGTGRISPTVPNGLLVNNGSSVSLVDGITEDLLVRFVSDGAGDLVPGTANFSAGSTFNFELAAPGTSDSIDFSGLATFGAGAGGGGSVAFSDNVVNFTGLSGVAAGDYTLFTFNAASKFTGTLVAGTLPAGITGASFTYNATDIKVTLTAGSDYGTWATGFSLENPWVTLGTPALNGEPTGDPDNDGVVNQQEYAFGLSPVSGSSVNPIAVQLDKTTGLFSYTRRLPSLSGLVYTYEYSTTLGGWTLFTPDSTATNSATPTETITVDVPNALLANPKLFVRVIAQ